MNKRIKLLMSLLMVTFLTISFNVGVFAFTGSGEGTESDPYIITTSAQISEIKNDLAGNYKLSNDIDMNGVKHVPIGSSNVISFTGIFDGAGFKINNLKVIAANSNSGLFGYARDATIKNLRVENANIIGGSNVSVLLSEAKNTNIINCSTSGIMSASGSSVGRIVAYLNAGTIESSNSSVSIFSTTPKTSGYGGLVGMASTAKIKKSYFTGAIGTDSDIQNVGGLIGSVTGVTTIEDSYSMGYISGGYGTYIGGLIGKVNSQSTEIKNSYFAGRINLTTVNSAYCFGLVDEGSKGVVIINSYFDKAENATVKYLQHGKTTSELQKKSIYASWNFNDIWEINEEASYPYLREDNNLQNSMEGTGTEESPYIITTPEQFSSIRYKLNSYYKLGNDIDFENSYFIPIGDFFANGVACEKTFSGSLDGNGHKVKNIKIDSINVSTGIFSKTTGATIKNINIENAYINGKNTVGILVGYTKNTTIINCHTNGLLNPSGNVAGGLVGYAMDTIIESSSSDATISAVSVGYHYGGLVGSANNSIIKKSNFSGKINKLSNITNAGGIVGTTNGTNKIEDSFVTGTIDCGAGDYAGGIVGRLSAGSLEIKNSYFIG